MLSDAFLLKWYLVPDWRASWITNFLMLNLEEFPLNIHSTSSSSTLFLLIYTQAHTHSFTLNLNRTFVLRLTLTLGFSKGLGLDVEAALWIAPSQQSSLEVHSKLIYSKFWRFKIYFSEMDKYLCDLWIFSSSKNSNSISQNTSWA